MSTIGQSLRLSLARTLHRGAFWLDRLAARLMPAKPVAPVAEEPPAEGGPPAHWLRRVHRRPPAHWLARIRQQAPHLLHGESLADTGWTRVIVPSPAAPVADLLSATGEASSPSQPGGHSEPVFTGQPPIARPPPRAVSLFAGRALRLRPVQPPVPSAAGAAPAIPAQPSPYTYAASWSGAPSARPATASAGTPTLVTPRPGSESPQWPAVNPDAAVTLPAAGAHPAGRRSGWQRFSRTDTTPHVPARHVTGWVLGDEARPPASAPDTAAGGHPAQAPASPDWPSMWPVETPAVHGAGAGSPASAPQAPQRHPANLTPNWGVAPPHGAAETHASDSQRTGLASEVPGRRWPPPVSAWNAAAPEPARPAPLPWPAVPDWPAAAETEPNPDDLARQHLQRLDREQRGMLWNESPF